MFGSIAFLGFSMGTDVWAPLVSLHLWTDLGPEGNWISGAQGVGAGGGARGSAGGRADGTCRGERRVPGSGGGRLTRAEELGGGAERRTAIVS